MRMGRASASRRRQYVLRLRFSHEYFGSLDVRLVCMRVHEGRDARGFVKQATVDLERRANPYGGNSWPIPRRIGPAWQGRTKTEEGYRLTRDCKHLQASGL
jgi:hypothetical protein